MVPLSVCMKAAATFPKTAKEALRALGAAAQHKAFGLVLLQTQGVVSSPLSFVVHLALVSHVLDMTKTKCFGSSRDDMGQTQGMAS